MFSNSQILALVRRLRQAVAALQLQVSSSSPTAQVLTSSIQSSASFLPAVVSSPGFTLTHDGTSFVVTPKAGKKILAVIPLSHHQAYQYEAIESVGSWFLYGVKPQIVTGSGAPTGALEPADLLVTFPVSFTTPGGARVVNATWSATDKCYVMSLNDANSGNPATSLSLSRQGFVTYQWLNNAPMVAAILDQFVYFRTPDGLQFTRGSGTIMNLSVNLGSRLTQVSWGTVASSGGLSTELKFLVLYI